MTASLEAWTSTLRFSNPTSNTSQGMDSIWRYQSQQTWSGKCRSDDFYSSYLQILVHSEWTRLKCHDSNPEFLLLLSPGRPIHWKVLRHSQEKLKSEVHTDRVALLDGPSISELAFPCYADDSELWRPAFAEMPSRAPRPSLSST